MNPNLELALNFVEALAHTGVKEVVIAPGSRSTPLTLAFAQSSQIRMYMHLDERSAAFFALGLALANDRPVAVLCTSGSAAANFMPAVVEARMSAIPLLLLTADRPHELRGSGANQTIDQIKLYGDQVLLSVDMPILDKTPGGLGEPAGADGDREDELVLRHVRSMAGRAVAVANGLPKGPVHLNFPFRKPLEPQEGETLSSLQDRLTSAGKGFARIERGRLEISAPQLANLAQRLSTHRRGLIVCGPRCPGGNFPKLLSQLAKRVGYPILADPLSGLRFGSHLEGGLVVGGYDTFLASGITDEPNPEIVVRFGGVPTSAVLNQYLARIRPDVRIHIREDGVWADDDHRTDWFLQVGETRLCEKLLESTTERRDRSWLDGWMRIEQRTWKGVHAALIHSPGFDGAVVAQIAQKMPDGVRLFVGNSLPVRHLDRFGQPLHRNIAVYGNRGASGIDGNISTALGIAASDPERPLLAVVGDITFYHDMNGLLAIQKHQLNNITIVILNNNGGGIFHSLPVARFEPPFQEAFLTPHGLKFEAAARLYGLNYRSIDLRTHLRTQSEKWTEQLEDCLQAPNPGVIEIFSNSLDDLRYRKTVSEEALNYILDGEP
jgi:2-succinyl-5-enolpyruvyl-6-hydroxy-3-cyclohexene-1-carboxylate synthase